MLLDPSGFMVPSRMWTNRHTRCRAGPRLEEVFENERAQVRQHAIHMHVKVSSYIMFELRTACASSV